MTPDSVSREYILKAMNFMLRDVVVFCRTASRIKLRNYQENAARAIVDSVMQKRGLSLVVMFPRQSGKNEVQAQVEAYLLALFMEQDAEMVKVSPTWKPQSINAMHRLERVLSSNWFTTDFWKKESGYIYRIGRARISFLSGGDEANIVGATASTLLEVDEAQDVSTAKFDKDIAPMAASTNATRVFWGTAWTSRTLLARELRASRKAEEADQVQRVFVSDAEDVAHEVPAYGEFVAQQVAALGRQHPMVRTQFFSEEIDSSGGMFPPERRSLMQGEHPRSLTPHTGRVYAFLIDVAGEDAQADTKEVLHANPLSGARDATALTIVELDFSTLADELLKAPTYKVVERRIWVGASQAVLYAELKALAGVWRPRRVVVDATGVGAGLASFLERALPNRVTSFVFTTVSKSSLGWQFLSICDTGRFKDWNPNLPVQSGGKTAAANLHALFWQQVDACEFEIRPGPGELLRWGTPNGVRDPQTGEYLHDDLLISAAFCAVLDGQKWSSPTPAAGVISPKDPLLEFDKGY
jgi:hypothetical protein